MERRLTERYEINIDTHIIYEKTLVNGIIENFSDGGLGIRCAAVEGLKPIETGDIIKVEFNVFYNDTVCFPCEVRWKQEFNDPVHGSILRIGMEHLKAADNSNLIC